MHLKEVTFHSGKYPARDCYPFNLPLFHETKQITFNSPITLFAGENGTGKSTLLEALAAACNIHIWRNMATSRPDCNPYEDKFNRYISVAWSNGRVPALFSDRECFSTLPSCWMSGRRIGAS